MSNKVCFKSDTFFVYIVVGIVTLAIALGYYKITEDIRFTEFCSTLMSKLPTNSTPSQITVKIPEQRESIPERRYISSRDYTQNSQQVGYVYNEELRLPLYENRIDRNYYYHVIDDSRNSVRIVVETNNKREQLFDGTEVNIPELGGTFTVKLYDYQGTRYNPYIV